MQKRNEKTINDNATKTIDAHLVVALFDVMLLVLFEVL